MNNDRLQVTRGQLNETYGVPLYNLMPASGDTSYRFPILVDGVQQGSAEWTLVASGLTEDNTHMAVLRSPDGSTQVVRTDHLETMSNATVTDIAEVAVRASLNDSLEWKVVDPGRTVEVLKDSDRHR